jgi:Hydrogenase maturation factor
LGWRIFVAIKNGSFERVAHLRQFRLPGGDQAVKEPRRSALGVLHELLGEKVWDEDLIRSVFANNELSILRTMVEKNLNAPVTSSAGRLFDAVSALIGLRQRASFEGQAAMELEFSADVDLRDAYPFTLTEKIRW